jgi:hypothetical protein
MDPNEKPHPTKETGDRIAPFDHRSSWPPEPRQRVPGIAPGPAAASPDRHNKKTIITPGLRINDKMTMSTKYFGKGFSDFRGRLRPVAATHPAYFAPLNDPVLSNLAWCGRQR